MTGPQAASSTCVAYTHGLARRTRAVLNPRPRNLRSSLGPLLTFLILFPISIHSESIRSRLESWFTTSYPGDARRLLTLILAAVEGGCGRWLAVLPARWAQGLGLSQEQRWQCLPKGRSPGSPNVHQKWRSAVDKKCLVQVPDLGQTPEARYASVSHVFQCEEYYYAWL